MNNKCKSHDLEVKIRDHFKGACTTSCLRGMMVGSEELSFLPLIFRLLSFRSDYQVFRPLTSAKFLGPDWIPRSPVRPEPHPWFKTLPWRSRSIFPTLAVWGIPLCPTFFLRRTTNAKPFTLIQCGKRVQDMTSTIYFWSAANRTTKDSVWHCASHTL